MKTKSEIQITPKIHFKSNEIENSFKKNGFYKSGTISIYQLLDFDQYIPQDEYIPPEEDYVFALENKDENIPFLGVVNFNFERFGYCLNTYINGDIYFGFYNKDIIEKKGLYSYKPIINKDYKLSHYYFGEWNNNLIDGKGIYLWVKDNINTSSLFNDFNNASYDSFIGISEQDLFKKGVLLSYNDNNNFFIYYGTLSPDGKKDGNKCFYYSNNLDKMCFGTYKDDTFIEGFVARFNKEGKMVDLIAYKNEDNVSKGEKVKIEKERNIEYIMTKFRKIIFKKNHFKIIYEEFGKILKFRDEKMNDINIYVNNKYDEIVNLFESNKMFDFYDEIEKNLW